MRNGNFLVFKNLASKFGLGDKILPLHVKTGIKLEPKSELLVWFIKAISPGPILNFMKLVPHVRNLVHKGTGPIFLGNYLPHVFLFLDIFMMKNVASMSPSRKPFSRTII